MGRFIIPFIIVFILELYTFFALRKLTKNKIVLIGFWGLFVVLCSVFYYQMSLVQKDIRFSINTGYAIALFLTFVVPKLVVFAFLFIEDIIRVFGTLFNYFKGDTTFKEAIPERRKFISQLALGIAAIPFAGFVFGVFKGRYNFKVITQQIVFDDLPEAFDGYRITQISDIHSGSFDDKAKIEYAVDLVNQQKSDAILFTGDIVNAVAEEMNPWLDTFKNLEAKDGMYSVLGNHDYGYYAYNTDEEILDNHKKIEAIHKEIGFDLLLNDSRTIERDGQEINILGVENWGNPPFKKYGDLDKALESVKQIPIKILLSHDPTHWPEEVVDHTDICLTLSGHTHGMQAGVNLKNKQWSPIKYKYKHWAGLHKEGDQYLNVNRGLGWLGFPGRLGMRPEITCIDISG